MRLYGIVLCGFVSLTSSPSLAAQQAALSTFRSDHHELRGHNRACWCKAGQPCHADVLIETVAALEKSA